MEIMTAGWIEPITLTWMPYFIDGLWMNHSTKSDYGWPMDCGCSSPKMDIKMQKLLISTVARIQNANSRNYSVFGWILITCYHCVCGRVCVCTCTLCQDSYLTLTLTHSLAVIKMTTTVPHHLLLCKNRDNERHAESLITVLAQFLHP